MFGIGFGEMLIIALVLLLAVGPKELPALLKSVGKGVREVRKASDDLRRSVGVDALLAEDELRSMREIKHELEGMGRLSPVGGAASAAGKGALPGQRAPYRLTAADREREAPADGVDLAFARSRAEAAARVPQGPPSGAPTPSEATAPTTREDG